MQGIAMVGRLRRMWQQHRLRMGLGLGSALAIATLLAIPVTRGSDDEILLYPLASANYGALQRLTGSAPAGQTLRVEVNHVVVAKTRANESGDFAVAFESPVGDNTIQVIADGLNVHPLESAVYSVRQVATAGRGNASGMAAKATLAANAIMQLATAPTITAPAATTTSNPITLSGTAPASAKVGFYVNGRFTREVVAAANGTYSTWVPLEDGLNSVYAVATDNTGSSPASNTVQTTYTNSLPRTYAASTISTPTVWTAGSAPAYTLNGDLTIGSGATLWVQPGVTVNVAGAYSIIANGSFVVRGTSSSRTVLRPTQTLCTSASTGRYDWNGVQASTSSGVVSLEYADILCAKNGVYFNLGTGSIAYSRILAGSVGVRTVSSASATTAAPQIVGQNELRGNSNGVYVDQYSSPLVSGNNLITGNDYGIYVNGSTTATKNPAPIVTGNSLYGNTYKNYSADNFINPASTILNATGNWWGTADPAVIVSKLEDRNGKPSYSARPFVDYSGFLGAAGGTSVYSGPTLVGPITATSTLAVGDYLVISDLIVNSGVTWTLSPGTTLRVAGGRKILVNGALKASGSSTQRVRFDSGQPNAAIKDWPGIEVGAGASATLNYARVEHATNGVFFNGGQGTITHSLIRFCEYGIYVGAKSSPTINLGNEISNNNYGVYVYGDSTLAGNPNPVLTGNSLFANATFNYYSYGFVTPKPTLNATGNWWGTGVQSGVIATISTGFSSSAPVDSSGFLTAAPFAPAINFSALSMSAQSVNPPVSTVPASGTYTLNRSGTVAFKILRNSDNAIVRQWSQSATAGQNSFSWDGLGATGQLLSQGLYRAVLTATDGLDPITFDPPAPDVLVGNTNGGGPMPTTFNPYLGQLLKMSVTYQKPTVAWLSVTPQGGNAFMVLMNTYYPAGGPYWLYWDGRGPDGQLLTVPATVWAGDGTILRPNDIFVFAPKAEITGTGAAPNIEVRSDPYLVASSYEQASKIVYRVSLDAVVRVTVLPPGVVDPASPSAIVLVNNVTQPAKDAGGNPINYTAEWRGYSAADPNAMLAGAEGAYTFAIEATVPATGQKTLYRGIINIMQ